MITLILIFIFEMCFLLVGYFLGSKRDFKEDLQRIKNNPLFIPKEELKVGAIKRPSAYDLKLRNEDPNKIAEKKALLESLENSELKDIKDKVNEMKAKGMIINEM